jgi:hypothetical protein
VRNRGERGAIANVAGTISFVPAVFVVVYGFERVWIAAFQAGLPRWGVRGVVLAFVAAVPVFTTFVLKPAIQAVLERLVALVNARADQGGTGS